MRLIVLCGTFSGFRCAPASAIGGAVLDWVNYLHGIHDVLSLFFLARVGKCKRVRGNTQEVSELIYHDPTHI